MCSLKHQCLKKKKRNLITYVTLLPLHMQCLIDKLFISCFLVKDSYISWSTVRFLFSLFSLVSSQILTIEYIYKRCWRDASKRVKFSLGFSYSADKLYFETTNRFVESKWFLFTFHTPVRDEVFLHPLSIKDRPLPCLSWMSISVVVCRTVKLLDFAHFLLHLCIL